MKKFKTVADIEAAIISGEISTTAQLRKALALLEASIDGQSRMSMAANLGFNDMRKAISARDNDLHNLKRKRNNPL